MFLERKNNSWLFAGVLLVCFLVSAEVRYQQFETWEKNPAAYFVKDWPIMTTLDAPLWLRIAREFNEGVYRQKEGLRGYPDSTNTYRKLSIPPEFTDPPSTSETLGIHYSKIPLLSFLIAHLAPFFNYNYYLTGTLLIPALASLFIIPLGIYFFQMGIPVSGLLGGLVGTFASAYYMRSSIGRIDTDMLNLFFPALVALLILRASQAKSVRVVLLYSAGVGLSVFLFHWWYFGKVGFTLIYFLVLVFSLFIQKIQFRTIIMSALLFVLCAQPQAFLNGTSDVKDFLNYYFVIEEFSGVQSETENTPLSFPNTFTTISEVDHVPMDVVFRRILSNPTLCWTGFLSFLVLGVMRWRVLLPLVPMLALGLLSFQSSNRFIMYLSPFIGIGLGWILSLGVEGLFYFLQRNNEESKERKKNMTKGESKKGKVKGSILAYFYSLATDIRIKASKNDTDNMVKVESRMREGSFFEGREIDWFGWTRQGTLYLGVIAFFWIISGQTAISFVPGPSIHPRVFATFFEVKKQIPEDSALLTWWDYGYAITDATGLATFHDGGGQQSPKTFFIARGLISSKPDELYDITQYLATEGNRGIAENSTSPEALIEAVSNPQLKPWDPIYLFFTADMTGKFGAISKLGSWDIEKGGSKPRAYQNLACNKITNQEMSCRGSKIDLKAGFINNRLALRRLIFIRNGQVIREQKFGHAQGFTLQLIVVGKNIVEVQLIDEAVFLSNYNQMFLLGRYRKDLYEESYNAFPFSRLYRVKY